MKGFLVGVLSAVLICSTAAFVQSVPPTLPPKLVELNNRISWHDIDDGTGNLVRTLRFNGINVQITNGLGTTASFNSAGNLIVGYNEYRTGTGAINNRTGSHAVILGYENNHTNHSNAVFGLTCNANNSFACVLGGRDNQALGLYSVVSGGELNQALGESSSISGGKNGQATGYWSSISGGGNSIIPNIASGPFSSISGGQQGVASGNTSHICGGTQNVATFTNSTIGGGFGRFDINSEDWIAGSLREDN